ncbi:MAG: hypothetical protein ACRDHD_12705 [Candidatus Limnocylindria bacterium]
MPEPPAWARTLVLAVCARTDAPLPRLGWRERDRPTSSGVTRQASGSITLVAGTDPADQRLTLLHELAHWLAPASTRRRRRTAHHGRDFYRTAFTLYAEHGVPVAAALAGEGARYPSSLRHAAALGIPGAAGLVAERRAQLRERARRRPPLRVLVDEHAVRLVRDGRWTRCGVCGVRIVGPVLARLRRRSGRHVLLGTG